MPGAIEQGVGDFLSDPVGSMYRNPITTAMTIAGGIKGVSDIFDTTPDLVKSGIKETTIRHMVPEGMNPAKFTQQLQDELNSENLLGKNASITWDKFEPEMKDSAQEVGAVRQEIADSPAGPDALKVDAQTALQPIYDAWGKEVEAIVPDRTVLKKFGDYYNGLMEAAKNQDGKLTMDDVHKFLQEIGPKTHAGSEANQAIFSKMYAVAMDAQDKIVNTVADQSGNPELGQKLIDANARFSRNARLMPDIAAAAGKYGLQEAVSTFNRLVRSPVSKVVAGFAGLEGIHHVLNTFGGE